MKRSVKLWIEALRSGKYKEGQLKLKTKTGGFCCLGVACDIYNKKHKKKVSLSGVYLDEERIVVREWLGLSSCKGQYYDPSIFDQSLAKLNDSYKSFRIIADVIESCPEGLFKREQ